MSAPDNQCLRLSAPVIKGPNMKHVPAIAIAGPLTLQSVLDQIANNAAIDHLG